MEANEALDRISYINELIEEDGRGRLSRAWPVVILWGALFCFVGFATVWGLMGLPLNETLFSHSLFFSNSAMGFFVFTGLPTLFLILLARPTTAQGKRLRFLIPLLALIFISFTYLGMSWLSTSHALPILAVGILIAATGAVLGPSLIKIGLLLAFIGALVHVLMDLSPVWFQLITPRSSTAMGHGGFMYRYGVTLGLPYVVAGAILMVYSIWLRSSAE